MAEEKEGKVKRPWEDGEPEEPEVSGAPLWQKIAISPLTGMEGTLGMIGATATYPFRKPPSEWLKGPFGPAGYEEYQQWKGGPTEPYVPLGAPSWKQWGGMLGLGEKPEGYEQAKIGMGDIAELAPFMFMGGGAATAMPKAGETLWAKPGMFGLKTPPAQAITKKQASQLLQKEFARGEKLTPELVEKVKPTITKPLTDAAKPLPGVIEKPIATAEENVVNKLTNLIKAAKPARGETEALKHKELAQRVGAAARTLEVGEGREAFLTSKKFLKGEMPKAEFVPPELKFSEGEITQLYDIIRKSDLRYFEKLHTAEGLDRLLLEGRIPQQAQLELLEDVFGKDLITAILGKRPLSSKIWWTALDIAGIPRAILASWDLSAVLRQGGILFPRHPIKSVRSIMPMLKAFGSDKNAAVIYENMTKRPHFQLAQDAGLYIAPLPGKTATKLAQREEMYMTRFTKYFPLVKQSEKAFVTFLNEQRTRIWEGLVPQWEKLGATMGDYKELAKFINYASGRGDLGPLRSMGPLMNATLFSPRLVMSRLELPAKLISRSPFVRKEAWKTLMSFLGFGASILSSLKLMGADVELDPRSSDFGKAIIGNTRLDFWAGYAQYARFAGQLATAQRKVAGGGKLQELNRREVVDRFLQSKYSPAFGLMNDILKGTTYIGEEMALDTESLKRQAYQRLTPLFVQDMIDAIQTDGLIGAFSALPGLFGVGVVSYKPWKSGTKPGKGKGRWVPPRQ